MEKKRTREVVVAAYKIMTGKETMSVHKMLEINVENRIRGHGYAQYKNKLGP